MVPLAGTDVRGLRAFLALRHLVGHLLPLVEVPEILTSDRAEVHERICAAVVGRDEAEALLGAETLDGGCCHVRSLLPSPLGLWCLPVVFFFQAEDGIRDLTVTGVQTCALPI